MTALHLSIDDKRMLLRLARATVVRAARGEPMPVAQQPETLPDALREPRAAFVSLHTARNHRLRGCIGCLEVRNTLADAVLENAHAAATRDPRFDPVRADEVDALDIEISVLGPLVPVQDVGEIAVGRDGVSVSRDGRRGVLLPQVAVQLGWEREEFLDHACRKADLPPDAWRHGATVQRFEAEVFSEANLAQTVDTDSD